MSNYEGGCHCGSVRFELSATPKGGTACHCKACQRRTGSDYGLSVWVDPSTLISFTGPTKIFTRRGDSGNEVRYEFCENCGTTLRWSVPALGDRFVYAGGTFDDMSITTVFGEMYTEVAGPRGSLGCDLATPGAPDNAWRSAIAEQMNSRS